ncbi:hypothetical protein RUND412_010139 [Rhizina undulata]
MATAPTTITPSPSLASLPAPSPGPPASSSPQNEASISSSQIGPSTSASTSPAQAPASLPSHQQIPSPAPRQTAQQSPVVGSAPPAPPTGPTGPQSQFRRFRMNEFSVARPSEPTVISSPAGQCLRFRVTEFIPYSNSSEVSTPATIAQAVQSNVVSGRPSSSNGPGSASANGQTSASRTGSFQVMHMDLDVSAAQQTSSPMAASAGSGRGMLQKVSVPAGGQPIAPAAVKHIQPRPLAPSPVTTAPPKFHYPPNIAPGAAPDAVWEVTRILALFQTIPAEAVVKQISDAISAWPSLTEGSLLRRLVEIFPPPLPPPPFIAQKNQATQEKKKRGRPPGKKAKLNDGSSAPVPIAANPLTLMPPPPVPYMPLTAPPAPPAPTPAPPPPTSSKKKVDPDKMMTCTRCLKPFSPAWRATGASDPSSPGTCAVQHPYKDFASGLEVIAPARRKNNYKTTWRWKCCGREVQSSSDELLMWPRKEDDRTGGWCHVGRHTTDPNAREKLGMKPGKSKKVLEDPKKRRKAGEVDGQENGIGQIDNASAGENSGLATQPQNWNFPGQVDLTGQANGGLSEAYAISPAPAPQPVPIVPPALFSEESEPPEEPAKRRRGRPKGSKTRTKGMQMLVASKQNASSSSQQPPPVTGPEQQLLNEAQQVQETLEDGEEDEDDEQENIFWTQYTEPEPEPDMDEENQQDGEAEDDVPHLEDPAISTEHLSLLASANRAMSAAQDQQDHTILLPPSSDQPEDVEKRKRGRPRGSKNMSTKAQEAASAQMMQQLQKNIKAATASSVPQQSPRPQQQPQQPPQQPLQPSGRLRSEKTETQTAGRNQVPTTNANINPNVNVVVGQDEESFMGMGNLGMGRYNGTIMGAENGQWLFGN